MSPKKQPELFTGKDLANLELERDFQRRVEEFMRINGWTVYSIPDSRRVTLAGYPDITAWRVEDRRLVFIELKREKGRVSPAQDAILDELRQLGVAEVYIFRPSDWDELVARLGRHR